MKKILYAVMIIATTMSVTAQKLMDNLAPFKGQKEVNVVLDFTGTLVNGEPEEDHIEYFIKDKNEEEKEHWLKEWNEDLRIRSYSLFVTHLNNRISKKTGITVGKYPEAEYTIYVKVKNIIPGYGMLAGKKGATVKSSKAVCEVTTEISFVKTGETTPFATDEYKEYGGSVPYFVERIAKAFFVTAYRLGKNMEKNY